MANQANDVLVVGAAYSFLFHYDTPLEYTSDPFYGAFQSFIPNQPPGAQIQQNGWFLGKLPSGLHVFYGYTYGPVVSENNEPERQERLFFVSDRARVFQQVAGTAPLPEEMVEKLTGFLQGGDLPTIPADRDTELQFDYYEHAVLRAFKRRVAQKKLKLFGAHIQAMPPTTHVAPNKTFRWSGGPYYKRAAENWAKQVHGKPRRRRSTRRRRNRRRRL